MKDINFRLAVLAVVVCFSMSIGSIVYLGKSHAASDIHIERVTDDVLCARVLINDNAIFSCWKESK